MRIGVQLASFAPVGADARARRRELDEHIALAEELATLDVLSDGRLTIGIGAGYRGAEFAAVGIPQEERYPRLEQGVSLLRRLWHGEAVTDDGPFGSLEQARLHLRPVQ